MDVAMARSLIAAGDLKAVTDYLESQWSEPVPKCGCTVMELMQWMRRQKPVEYQEEYLTAQMILKHNTRPGSMDELDCPKCLNRGGFHILTVDGEEVYRECECMARRRCVRNARASGMGSLLSHTLENFEISSGWQKTISDTAKDYLEAGENSWFCMMGQSGAGKTHICSAIANRFLEKGKTAVYMSWNVAVRELKQNTMDSEEYQTLFRRYIEPDVLYIDDLFKGKTTEADLSIAFDIINHRYNNPQAVTLISTEQSMDELLTKDVALAGRIKQRCGKYIVQIGPDSRKNYRFQERAVANG